MPPCGEINNCIPLFYTSSQLAIFCSVDSVLFYICSHSLSDSKCVHFVLWCHTEVGVWEGPRCMVTGNRPRDTSGSARAPCKCRHSTWRYQFPRTNICSKTTEGLQQLDFVTSEVWSPEEGCTLNIFAIRTSLLNSEMKKIDCHKYHLSFW